MSKKSFNYSKPKASVVNLKRAKSRVTAIVSKYNTFRNRGYNTFRILNASIWELT